MDQRDSTGALAHCRRDALHAAGPDVTYGEDARKTCFENKRGASQRPVGGHQVGLRYVRACLHEPLGVKGHTALKPTSIRHSADHEEDMPDVANLDNTGDVVSPLHTLEVSVAFERDEIDVRVQHDRGALLNPSNQIARHRCRETLRADEHVDPAGSPREEDSGLAGGVPTPDDDDFFA